MTTKQKQCLLEYLGYYDKENRGGTNNIDGIWGEQSKTATRRFQGDYGLEVDGIFGPATEAKIREVVHTGAVAKVSWDTVKYFKQEEFKCKCGGAYCDGFPAAVRPALVRVADRVRAHFGAAAIVSSGVRCKTHNAKVGGVATSRHLAGKAMDFRIAGKTAAQVLEYVKQQPEVRYAYAIDSLYVHMDVD